MGTKPRKSTRASKRASPPSIAKHPQLASLLDRLDVIVSSAVVLEQALDAEDDTRPHAVVTLNHVVLPLEALAEALCAFKDGGRINEPSSVDRRTQARAGVIGDVRAP